MTIRPAQNFFARGTRHLGLLAMFISLSALAHDPLQEVQKADHHGHETRHGHAEHRANTDAVAPASILAGARERVLTFRKTGNDRHLDAAWELLEPALEAQDAGSEFLVTAAFIAQSRHEFEEALRLLDQALAANPHNDEGWLLHASIELVGGDAAAATRSCGRLTSSPAIVLITCKARIALAEASNNAVGFESLSTALSRLTRVLDAVHEERLTPDLLAWSYSVAGDLAVSAGDSTEALRLYARSLSFAERTQVRAALVDVLLSERDYEAAWERLTIAPPALPLLVRQLITARKLGRLDAMSSELTKVQREFDDWIEKSDWLHAREMTRFFIDVVDRPQLARRLALINIGLQREPEDIRLERRTRRHAIS